MYPSQRIQTLFKIEKPIIQGGMVWVSGGKLSAAAANAGCLGLVGAGSMKPELLDHHLKKAISLTENKHAIGVNIPLLYKYVEEQIETSLRNGVRVFFTSAGSPKKYTKYLKEQGATVVHVCASPLLAHKCQDAGVDAVVCEGFEAGGHNGREEITTMCLIPEIKSTISIPIIAAGGIGCARSMAAAFCLGADAVQMGTRFLMTEESSAHDAYKELILNAKAGDTKLMMKKHIPVRLLKNHFFNEVSKLEDRCASKEELIHLLGKGRAKKGMLEGDVDDGELEIGQVSSLMTSIPSTKEMILNIENDYNELIKAFI